MPSDNGQSCLETIVNLADLSTMLVISERTLQRLVKQHVIPLAKNERGQMLRGKFVLGVAVSHYLEFLRDSLMTDDPAKSEYHRERAAKMKAERAITELDLQERQGQMVRISDIEFELSQTLSNIRDAFRSLPSRLMHELCHQKDPRTTNQILTDAIDATLHRVADGEVFDIKRLKRETREYLRSQGLDSATVEEIVAKKDRRREQNIKQRRAERERGD
jgi:phage terminase Nu1 subunit (DNA packaging protein)